MKDSKAERRLVDSNELAQILGVGRQWVYLQYRKGRLPGYKVGHFVRFDPDEVLMAIKARKRIPPIYGE